MTQTVRTICIEEAQPGMVLGSTALAVEKGLLGLKFPPGMVLTADSIAQLVAHHAEYLDIEEEDTRTDTERAAAREAIERELQDILKGCALQHPAVSALVAQLVDYRSGTCPH